MFCATGEHESAVELVVGGVSADFLPTLVENDKTITALKDKTVRRLIVRDRYIYVLALDAESKPSMP